jgi:hypothetical protein
VNVNKTEKIKDLTVECKGNSMAPKVITDIVIEKRACGKKCNPTCPF